MPPSNGSSSKNIRPHARRLPKMGHAQIIQSRLSIIRRRMQTQATFIQLARHGFWGLALTGGLMLLNRFVQLPNPHIFFFPVMLSIIVAISLSLAKKSTLSAAARVLDEQLDLKERFTTAVELIQKGARDDLSRLQIRDTAAFGADIIPSNAARYSPPPALKWFPIAVLIILVSFAVPRTYELPFPLTAAEQKAITDTAEVLDRMTHEIDDPELIIKIQDTIRATKGADVHTVQERLSQLRDDVRARKQLFPEDEIKEAIRAISEASQASNRFKDRNTGQFAEALDELASEQELYPELQAELRALFDAISQQLAENHVTGNLSKELAQVQTQTVSPDTLRKIARLLADLDELAKNSAQLEQILAQIMTSRKLVALASIEMNRESGGVANTGGEPGNESTTGETKGTLASGDPEINPKNRTNDAELSDQQVQNESLPSLRAEGVLLTLIGDPSDSENFTSVFVGDETPSDDGEPEYISYRAVLLNARQHYLEAVKNDGIPLRYQQQIKDYLIALASLKQE